MNKLIIKSILFAAPFALVMALELYVIPTEFWTFRVWEAALNSTGKVQGPFIPNLHIKKLETGDQRLPDGPAKQVEWFTDKYGYRNRPPLQKRYDVVAIGDSNFVGSFLDQKDTFAAALERECHCSVYNHAYQGPADIKSYFRQLRFVRDPPKLVVYDIRGFDLYDPVGWHGQSSESVADEDGTSLTDAEIQLLVRQARQNKQAVLNWLRARLGVAVRALPYSNLGPRARQKSNSELLAEHGDELAAILAAYRDRLKQRGTRFVVFLIDTDTQLEDGLRPYLTKAGIDLLSFPHVPDGRSKWFQQADSHWTELGAQAAAEVVSKYILEQGIVQPASQ